MASINNRFKNGLKKVVEKECDYCEKISQFICNRWDKPRECSFCEEEY